MRVQVVPVIDALDVDGERLVMVGERVVLLSAVASVVHRLLGAEPVSLPDLLDRIAAELPLPPDPERALEGLLDDLETEGLVRRIEP